MLPKVSHFMFLSVFGYKYVSIYVQFAILICACDGVNRTYVSSAHYDSSYFPLFKHPSAELLKVKNNTLSQCTQFEG